MRKLDVSGENKSSKGLIAHNILTIIYSISIISNNIAPTVHVCWVTLFISDGIQQFPIEIWMHISLTETYPYLFLHIIYS
jgi:hypothetical protein